MLAKCIANFPFYLLNWMLSCYALRTQANMPILTANSDASSAYAVVAFRRGWISCLKTTRATEILLSARHGCRCCLKMAMYLTRSLLRNPPILPQLIWVVRSMTMLSQTRLISAQCQICYQRIQRWKHYICMFSAKSAMSRFLYGHRRNNISLICQTFGGRRSMSSASHRHSCP
ncbi:hypothetical protein FOQG_17363 [Fusarium oxysporum f. sp. raphani 54005]|uniref:Secreted protein n=1 Tax=Fusarium oxysporum f. sp. raphani 54005 TaxID=1089458 RepID=X0C5C6_FUSOX|nr:hypothetical protein FOQG_17363 [Fusarium oxysporum f. sp. raphani 54005]